MPPKAAPRRGAAASAANRRPNASEAGSNPATPASAENASAGLSATARPPVQRLQSLKKRTPSGSIGPAAKPPGPGEPAKPTLKYKPRAVGRRSKEEREAIEKLEAERHRERLAEAAAIQRGRGNHGPGGRGGFGRGRGGQFGAASGPLGSMMGRRGRGGGGPGGFGARFGGQDSRASSMSRRSRSVVDLGSGAVSRDVSSDESDNEIRVSIDHINLDSDEEGEAEQVVDKKNGKVAMKSADTSGERGLRPIRVERHEHEERTVSVNMESSSSKSAELRQQAQAKAGEEESLFVQDDEGSATEKEIGTKVKKEPTDDDQAMADVAPHADEGLTTDDGLLPVQKVKVRRKISREPPAVKDPKSLLRTKEDIEEYERHEQDLAMVKNLFTKEEKSPAEEPKEPQPEQPEQLESSVGDGGPVTEGEEKEKDKEAEAEEDESATDKLAGQLFLMQFPPMTPNLVPGGDNPDVDSTGAQGQDDTENTDINNGNQPAPPAIKREDGGEIIDGADESQPREPSKVVTATDWQLRAGRVGKLNVHASGKMTMDWGGISFELDRATAVDFLQEALIVSGPTDPAEGEVPEDANRVWAMGQLSGKFTVTPDWEKML